MSNNIVPTNPGEIIILSGQMIDGLETLGAGLGITQITPATMGPLRDALITSQAAFDAARVFLQDRSDAFGVALSDLTTWVGAVRNALVPHLGNRWSTAWVGTGFGPNSTGVPASVAGRTGVAAAMTAYLTANPSYQVPATKVTPEGATVMNDTMTSLTNDWNAARMDSSAKLAVRDDAVAALRTSMSGLIAILKMLLAPDDPRWVQFGLNQPGADTTPGEPQNFTAVVTPEQAIMAQCDPLPLATRYRWRMKVVGVDTEFRLALSTKSPLAVISSVEPGQTVALFVQAVNGNAQGVPSEKVTVSLPGAQAAAPAAVASAEKTPATPGTAGDGRSHERNGHHGNGAALKMAR